MILQSAIMHSVFLLSVALLSFIMLMVITLSVILQSAVFLSVVALYQCPFQLVSAIYFDLMTFVLTPFFLPTWLGVQQVGLTLSIVSV